MPVDLLDWADALPVSMPARSDASPKRRRLHAGELAVPDMIAAPALRFEPGSRSTGDSAISIELLTFTAERRTFRALGLALAAYALSEQASPLRILLDADEAQLVVWPAAESPLDRMLGIRRRLALVHYRPALPKTRPNYTTTDQDRASFPRAHLPFARLGAPDIVGLCRPGQPVCAHLAGTAPSLIWLGKYLLNLALDDNPAFRGYLYNMDHAESLAPGSAEFRFEVTDALREYEARIGV